MLDSIISSRVLYYFAHPGPSAKTYSFSWMINIGKNCKFKNSIAWNFPFLHSVFPWILWIPLGFLLPPSPPKFQGWRFNCQSFVWQNTLSSDCKGEDKSVTEEMFLVWKFFYKCWKTMLFIQFIYPFMLLIIIKNIGQPQLGEFFQVGGSTQE